MRQLTSPVGAAFVAGAWVAMTWVGSSAALAQQQKQPATSQHSLTVPASDRVLEIRASLPGEVKVGQTFEYQIEIANVTEDVMLRDIAIRQAKDDGLAIQSAQMQRSQGQSQQQKQSQEQGQAQSSKQQSGQQQSQQPSQSQSGGEWTIDELGPGQKRTIQVTAIAEKEGELNTCLAITSYTPALCLTTRSVKAELELVKTAPEIADLCTVIEWEYYVKNTGSGDPGQFTIQDDLPDGLQTITGDKQLKFQVDGIEPNDVRKFVAKLQAAKAGDYRSVAVAMQEEGKQTRSQRAGTKVVAADLAVTIDGPRTRYVNRLVDYSVRVTNHGEAAATDTRLAVHHPSELQLVDVTQPRSSNEAVSRSNRAAQSQQNQDSQQQLQGQQQKPQRAPQQQGQQQQGQQQQGQQQQGQQQQGQQQQGQQQQGQQQQGGAASRQQRVPSSEMRTMQPSETQTWQLGTLKPGETVEVGFTMRGDRQGLAEFKAEAAYVCARADEQKETTSVATTQTRLIALPALMIAVVDNEDPVSTGENVSYTIVVGNEGEAPDNDVQVTVQLPEQMEFVEASGTTKAQSDGQSVQFQPVGEIRPGQKARWNLTAKVKQQGDVRLHVEMKSKHLSGTTTAEEPTVLFASEQQDSQGTTRR